MDPVSNEFFSPSFLNMNRQPRIIKHIRKNTNVREGKSNSLYRDNARKENRKKLISMRKNIMPFFWFVFLKFFGHSMQHARALVP